MGRLDTYLVESGLIPSRSRAKRAILYGIVKVNDQIIRKPAYMLKTADRVEVISEIATKPMGYWKLHFLCKILNLTLFSSTDIVLDLGSSAGGFLEYAAERCQQVYGIEVSDQFAPILHQLKQKYSNIVILIADAFLLDPQKNLAPKEIDLILNDLTLAPAESVKILIKFLPFLKKRGHLIISIKQGTYSTNRCKLFIENALTKQNLHIIRILDIDPEKKELHVIAQKP
ncbi:MAG: S4 domain-containing protein [Candidatus Helarchaeota archaeon]